MGGSTGNIRTLRNQSGTVGVRTLGSILASDSGAGAGSVRRIYGYYAQQSQPNGGASIFYNMFKLKYGQYRNRTEWFLSNYV